MYKLCVYYLYMLYPVPILESNSEKFDFFLLVVGHEVATSFAGFGCSNIKGEFIPAKNLPKKVRFIFEFNSRVLITLFKFSTDRNSA